MTHAGCGTRAKYQTHGCRCLPCRAANAQYVAQIRRQHLHGQPPLGTPVSAKEAGRLLRAILVERYRRRQVLAQTGLSYRTLKTLNASQRCRLETLLLLRHAYRILIAESRDVDAETN